MTEESKIEFGDSLFGVGLAVSDFINKDIIEEDRGEAVFTTKKDNDIKNSNNEKLEELRIICENEGLILSLSRHYIPYEKIEEGNYYSLDHDGMVLIKDLHIKIDLSDVEAEKLGRTFNKIMKYLKIEIQELFFFFYFPEKVIIDKGELKKELVYMSEWEKIENMKNFDDGEEI
jgi:hypothetical protein